MEFVDYLDRAKAKLGTDSAVGRAIGRQHKEIWAYRKKGIMPDVETATKLALVLDIEPMEIISCIGLQGAKNEGSRDFWKGFISQHWLAIFAALLLPILSFYGSGDSVTYGLIASAGANLPTINPHYATLNLLCEILSICLFALLPYIAILGRGFALSTGNLPSRASWPSPSRP